MTETQSSTATPERGKPERKRGRLARIGLFLRQVRSELLKVVWPNRRELITYTAVVMVFVALIMLIVAGLDLGLSKLVIWVYGD